jgi:hypothetical protein
MTTSILKLRSSPDAIPASGDPLPAVADQRERDARDR